MIPPFNSVQKQLNHQVIVLAPKADGVILVNLASGIRRALLGENCVFASWDSDGKRILAIPFSQNGLRVIDAETGTVERVLNVNNRAIREAYLLQTNREVLVRDAWTLKVADELSARCQPLGLSGISVVTQLAYSEFHGMAYILVPSDKDGRILMAFDPKTRRA